MRSYFTRFINNLIPESNLAARDKAIENLESRVARLERANLAILRRMVQIGNHALKDLELQASSPKTNKKVLVSSSSKHADELFAEDPTTTFH